MSRGDLLTPGGISPPAVFPLSKHLRWLPITSQLLRSRRAGPRPAPNHRFAPALGRTGCYHRSLSLSREKQNRCARLPVASAGRSVIGVALADSPTVSVSSLACPGLPTGVDETHVATLYAPRAFRQERLAMRSMSAARAGHERRRVCLRQPRPLRLDCVVYPGFG